MAKTAEPRLKKVYREEVAGALKERFGYGNVMQIPKVTKIVVNMGIGESTADSKKAQSAADDLTLIAGQKAVVTRAKKSIAGFKVRENMPIGAKVTLRGTRMYEFMDRLINIALPRVRDFRGLNPKSFDGHGNFALGIKEHIVFPEIDYDKVDQIWGMDVIVCTDADSDDEARALLAGFNFPFPKGSPQQSPEGPPEGSPDDSGGKGAPKDAPKKPAKDSEDADSEDEDSGEDESGSDDAGSDESGGEDSGGDDSGGDESGGDDAGGDDSDNKEREQAA